MIECLNAGDGSWWTGRLWRDKRMIGLFPSNFVEVLPENFRPMSRTTSPMTSTNAPSPKSAPQKSKTFRKPFEAYAKAPHYTTAKTDVTYKEGYDKSSEPVPVRQRSAVRSRENSAQSVKSNSHSRTIHDDIPSVPTPPRIHGYGSRAASPAPPMFDHRAQSPAPFANYRAHSPAPHFVHRTPSPAPFLDQNTPSPAPHFVHRTPSPVPSFENHQAQFTQTHTIPQGDSPPPPPPPPHRSFAGRHGSTTSNLSHENRIPDHGHGRHASPAPYGSHMPGYNHQYSHSQPVIPRHGSNLSYDGPVPLSMSYENNTPQHLSRQQSNASYYGLGSPPALRTRANTYDDQGLTVSRQNSNLSYNRQPGGYHTPQKPSPCPPSPNIQDGLTPPMLREAMDDVMEQLDALGMGRDDEGESPVREQDPWAPESFGMLQPSSPSRREPHRPQTSMGLSQHTDEGYGSHTGSGVSSRENTLHSQKPPDVSTYVDRMENKLRSMLDVDDAPPPPVPKKNTPFERPKSSMDTRESPKLRRKKSAYEVGRSMLNRTFTTKTTSTSTTQSTDRSLMSGVSAGGISATSAGSLARKNEARFRAQSAFGMREEDRPETPFTGVTYHSSHASDIRPKSQMGYIPAVDEIGGLGGLVSPRPKKQNFIKRMLESAKTGVASTRESVKTAGSSSVAASIVRPLSRGGGLSAGTGMPGISGPPPEPKGDTAREMGLGGGVDWVQVRRDVNRSNSLSRNERVERRDRCLMMDYPAIEPVEELYSSVEGDEGGDGRPVAEPTNYQNINFSMVDKNSRFVNNLPPTTTSISLATMYVCRPYRSDVQRLRAIFTWVAEKICWEEDFEGQVDTRRVITSKRGCSEEYAVLVHEMCGAVGLQCEVVRGYLKTPGEIPETSIMPRSNHWWNAVLVDNEWRIMDTSLASPSNPRRGLYSSAPSSAADSWWFLARPTEICWTHIPEHHAQQHICPPVAHEILLNLPCACPPFFKNELQVTDYNTSLTRIEDLEMVHIKFAVPADVECAAEVETRAFARDPDGDLFESGDVVKKRALAQADWSGGIKRYTVKALLPGDEGTGLLKIYAGKRGLMHSIKDIPHPLAFALPIVHSGENPSYEFVTRHPTPHAQRHDIYVVQPQCQRLALNNTFVFCVRQHPSSLEVGSVMTPASNPVTNGRGPSPVPYVRPGSSMSVTSSSAGLSTTSSSGGASGKKPAKLAIQTPGGKILRLMRKEERRGSDPETDGGTWETIIKCSERGVWRGLVLADRTARWCVFAEWVCVG